MAATSQRSWLRDNGLTLVLAVLFLGSFLGQIFSGFAAENQDRLQEGEALLSFGGYIGSGAFLSSVFENWESEFLQMWAYVMLTAYLYQRGSPESRDPDVEAPPRKGEEPGRKRSFGQVMYEHSLGLMLLACFVVSFLLHGFNSARHAAEDAAAKGLPEPTILDHLGDAQFWFESFQNWQSEFLSTAVLVVLGIFLRERQSPESKPVGAPNSQTGTD